MPQTEEQRKAALAGAGLTPEQQSGVTAGGGYTPISRTITATSDPNADAADKFLNTFTPPKTADQIAEDKRKQSQGLIDSITADYENRKAEAVKAGQERVNQNDAVSVLSGLMGSTEAVRTRGAVNDANQKQIDAINNQKALELAQVYSKINDAATTEARQQLEDATRSAEQIVARRKQVSEDAVNNLKLMASSGLVDFDKFKSDPKNIQVYQHALDAVGGSEDALRGLFMMNRPKDQLIGTPQRVGDHFIQAYQNPITGKVSYDRIEVPGLGPEYSSFQKMGDNLVAIPNGWDGDVTKLKTIVGQPSQSDLLDQQYKRAQIAKTYNDIANSGAGAVKLTASQKDDLATMDTVVSLAQGVKTLGEKIGFSGVGGLGAGSIKQFLAKNFGAGTTEEQGLRNDIGNIQGTIAKLRGGTSFTPNEQALLETYVPTINDSPLVIKSKIDSLVSFINTKKAALLSPASLSAVPANSGGDIKSAVAQAGYNYDAMKADGYSDDQIRAAIGL